jgi:glycosyltransferase involved in cell wall biosynthesis
MDEILGSRVAIISHALPPSPSGQAVALYRILSGVNPDDYYLISTGEAIVQEERGGGENPFQLGGQYYPLPLELTFTRLDHFRLSNIRTLINILTHIYIRTRNILIILRSEPNTTGIIACSGDLKDIPAAFLTSRMTHIPFFAYIFDDYVFQWTGNYRLFAKLIAPLIFKHSAGIIGPNEFICEEYRRRYNVNPILVRNPCDKNELEQEPYAPWPSEDGIIKIIYTGAVYHANYDCFRNLLSAMDSLREYPLELHIYTAQTYAQLQEQKIMGDNIFIHSHVPYNEILQEQRKADILFLPLAFSSPIPEVIRTSAPGKLGEYLASGRPVLAHVPADSFVADYCGRYDCAAIADQNDPARLAQEIRQIVTDEILRARIIGHALSRSKTDFHPQQASETLMQLLTGT